MPFCFSYHGHKKQNKCAIIGMPLGRARRWFLMQLLPNDLQILSLDQDNLEGLCLRMQFELLALDSTT